MMFVENKFNIGDTVFLKTDRDQGERLVTGIHIRPTGMTYSLSLGSAESSHYDFEISEERNVLMDK